MRTVLVVGASGYIGRAIQQVARGRGIRAIPVARREIDDLRQLRERHGADAVINAAGRKRGDLAALREANVKVVERLLTTLGENTTRLVSIGSAAEYGRPVDAGPFTEMAPARPDSDYGRSKLAATRLILDANARGQQAVVARVFNVVGPDQDARQPAGQFAQAVAALPPSGGTVSVHNAATVRDFVSLTFVARTVLTMAMQPLHTAEVNVCSGVGLRYGEIVAALLEHCEKSATIVDLEAPLPVPSIVGDPSRLRERYGLTESMTAERAARCLLPR